MSVQFDPTVDQDEYLRHLDAALAEVGHAGKAWRDRDGDGVWISGDVPGELLVKASALTMIGLGMPAHPIVCLHHRASKAEDDCRGVPAFEALLGQRACAA